MKKTLVVFIAVVVCANALSQSLIDEYKKKFQEVGKVCSTKTGASLDDIAELFAKKRPTRHEGMCMVHCFYEEFKVMKPDGSIDEEATIKFLEPLKADDPAVYDKVIEIGEKCISTVAKVDDLCVYATDLAECGLNEGRAAGLEAMLV